MLFSPLTFLLTSPLAKVFVRGFPTEPQLLARHYPEKSLLPLAGLPFSQPKASISKDSLEKVGSSGVRNVNNYGYKAFGKCSNNRVSKEYVDHEIH